MNHRKRRNWTDNKKRKVIQYYKEHGHSAARQRYRVSSSMLHNWLKEYKDDDQVVVRKTKKANQVHDAIFYLDKAVLISEDLNKDSLKSRMVYALIVLALDSLNG